MDHLQERLDALEQRTHNVARQLCWWRRTAWLLVGLGLVCLPLQAAHTQGADEVTAQALTLEQRVAALEAKLTYLNTRIDSSGRPLMEIAGANLRLVNGKGTTESVNGLGNLIVGYNEIRSAAQGANVRTGSHNIIVGKRHNYSRFGGLVVGTQNEISGAFASVSGGLLLRQWNAIPDVFRTIHPPLHCTPRLGVPSMGWLRSHLAPGPSRRWAL